MRQLSGDLTLGTARIGEMVACVMVPDITPWIQIARKQAFTLPEVGKRYYVRGNVSTANRSGIWLATGKLANGSLIPLWNPQVAGNLGEPFFAYHCFMVLSRP